MKAPPHCSVPSNFTPSLRKTIRAARRTQREVSRTAHRLLASDIELGLSLLCRAGTSSNPKTSARNLQQACTAYVTVRDRMTQFQLNKRQVASLQKRLAVLKARLEELGGPEMTTRNRDPRQH